MNDQQHLLWAILDEPHEDLHRLVFADWLEENGQGERAEFIRVQCDLAKLNRWVTPEGEVRYTVAPEAFRYREYGDLIQREAELIGSKSAIGVGASWPNSKLTFIRGFLSVISCTLADWLTYGEQIMACHPVERVVTEKVPNQGGTHDLWWWYRCETVVPNLPCHFLPSEVFSQLPTVTNLDYEWASTSYQLALDALNAVLVGEWRKREQANRKETLNVL